MFEIYCPDHRSRVLLSASRIEALRNTPDGPVLDWVCWCGARGSLAPGRDDREGRYRPVRPAPVGPTSDAA